MEGEVAVKILFLCPKINLDEPSGGTMHYLDLTRCMARKYPKIKVVLAASGKGWRRKDRNLEIAALRGIDTSIVMKDKTKTEKINKIIEETQPDFIYYRTEPFEDFPLNIRSEKPKVIEIGYNLFAKPYDVPVHVAAAWRARNALLLRWLKNAVKKFDCVLVQSESSARSLKKRINNKPVRVVMDAADTRKFRPHTKTSEKVKIVFVGNALKYQGVGVLLKAEKYIKTNDYSMTIIGRYSKKGSNASFTGFIPNEEAVKILEKCDVGVAPYLEAKNEPYGFSPIKIFEYMAAGLAVVATDTEWNREIITDGRNGLLFRENDPKDLARKIQSLVENRDLLERIKRNNVRDSRNHDWSKRAAEILDIFKELKEDFNT